MNSRFKYGQIVVLNKTLLIYGKIYMKNTQFMVHEHDWGNDYVYVSLVNGGPKIKVNSKSITSFPRGKIHLI